MGQRIHLHLLHHTHRRSLRNRSRFLNNHRRRIVWPYRSPSSPLPWLRTPPRTHLRQLQRRMGTSIFPQIQDAFLLVKEIVRKEEQRGVVGSLVGKERDRFRPAFLPQRPPC